MSNLFPEGYENEVIEEADLSKNSPIGYRNGVDFDYRFGDFKRDGMNKLMDSTGIESWKSWVINCLSTEKYSHLAYSGSFGIETTAAFKAESREEAESILTRGITEAVLADPYGRTAYVENIEYDWREPDTVEVKLTLRGLDDVSIDLTAYITQAQ